MKAFLVVGFVLLASPALAQQAPDPVLVQKVMTALQQQRNAAMDGQAEAAARAAMLTDEVAKLKERVVELEKAATPPVEPKP